MWYFLYKFVYALCISLYEHLLIFNLFKLYNHGFVVSFLSCAANADPKFL